MRKAIAAVTIFSLASLSPATFASNYKSVSHIHSVKVFQNQIILGTHEGLFSHQEKNSIARIGKEVFDVMGLATYGKKIYASGHPGAKSAFPNPLGLLRSTDQGLTWKGVSLQGEVDFHMLEVGRSEIYGADSLSEQLMYSPNLGKSWQKVGQNIYSKIAIDNRKIGHAYALTSGTLVKTSDAFLSSSTIKNSMKWSSIEMVGSKLYGASGKSLYRLFTNGKSPKKIATLSSEIVGISANKKLILALTSNSIFFAPYSKGPLEFRE
jgi:hypothetical protein